MLPALASAREEELSAGGNQEEEHVEAGEVVAEHWTAQWLEGGLKVAAQVEVERDPKGNGQH